jgi:hypothetical protein
MSWEVCETVLKRWGCGMIPTLPYVVVLCGVVHWAAINIPRRPHLLLRRRPARTILGTVVPLTRL